MKKVLIISYLFPPMNVIASRRAEAYAKYFHFHGISPTIVTHIWNAKPVSGSNEYTWEEHSSQQEPVIENHKDYTVVRLPRHVNRKQRLINYLLKKPIVKKITRFALCKSGHFEHEMIYSYDIFKSFLFNHLKNNSYDAVLPIFSPHFQVRLGYDLNKEFGIPFIADYRDLWDNRVMNDSLVKDRAERFINNQAKVWHTKWLQTSCLHSIVSGPWLEKLNELTNKKGGIVVTNGYDEELYKSDNTEISKEFFYFTHTGTVYPLQDYSYFFKAFNLFLQRLDQSDKQKVKVRFYLKQRFTNRKLFQDNIPSDNLELLNWIAKEEVVVRLKESAILFFPGWSQIRGWYPGKLFEYLGAERNILITPTDGSVEEELINYCNAGICSSDVEKNASFLYERFMEWKIDGACKYEGVKSRINEFSRQSQIEKFAKHIVDVISNKR